MMTMMAMMMMMLMLIFVVNNDEDDDNDCYYDVKFTNLNLFWIKISPGCRRTCSCSGCCPGINCHQNNSKNISNTLEHDHHCYHFENQPYHDGGHLCIVSRKHNYHHHHQRHHRHHNHHHHQDNSGHPLLSIPCTQGQSRSIRSVHNCISRRIFTTPDHHPFQAPRKLNHTHIYAYFGNAWILGTFGPATPPLGRWRTGVRS